MNKMLTVLVPIHGDEDFITVASSMPNIYNTEENIIYLYNNSYYRRFGSVVRTVTDVEFPEIGRPLELFDFSYSSTRMSTAPTIQASTKWYAERNNEDNLFYNLDDKWTQECHVEFDGQKYFLKNIPTSQKDNEDARYKYDMEFVSHWECLERVYIYDTVAPYIAERQLNESDKFSFFGDITMLRKRINSALVRSGLSSYVKKDGVGNYFTYQQWNDIPLGRQSDPNDYYATYQGDYTAYLQGEVFEYEDGEFVIDGYQVIIDDGVESEEKMITFDHNYIYDALQKICDKESGYGLSYYYKHGTKEIHIGDSEYDFGENNSVAYGAENELLLIKKANTTEKVINRMTGMGSSENIPHYYPNPTADGWLRSEYSRPSGGDNLPVVDDAQQSDIYPSPAANAYENFLKNRLGYKFEYGAIIDHIYGIGYSPDVSSIEVAGQSDGSTVYTGNRVVAHYYFTATKWGEGNIYVDDRTRRRVEVPINAFLNFRCNVSKKGDTGNTLRLRVLLVDVTDGSLVGQYDSDSYIPSTATVFEKMCDNSENSLGIQLTQGHTYDLSVYVYLDSVPLAEDYAYDGYRYSADVQSFDGVNYDIFDEEFYTQQGLKNKGSVIIQGNVPNDPTFKKYYLHRRCIDDSTADTINATSVDAMPRIKGKLYKDLSTGTIYKCTDATVFDVNQTTSANFEANPLMTLDEWFTRYMTLDIRLFNADGWYLNNKKVELSDYGMTLTGTPLFLDTITFQRVKYLTPQANLVPELYIKTDGERRFYNAVNYPHSGSTADEAAGETTDGTVVNNDLYKDEDDEYRVFENPYTPQLVSEDIRQYEDIKPSIKGMTNTVGGSTFRIDVAAEYAFDELDDDSVWESEENGNIVGEYKHPHFFVKLRQLPFNIFDLALTDDMEISMTSGACGACKFKIKVDESTKKNPVQVWEEDVYTTGVFSSETSYTLYAAAGSLKRYTSKKLYRKVRKSYTDESGGVPVSVVYYEYDEINTHWDSMYTADAIQNGLVGTLNTENYNKTEGDVVTRGMFQQSQQDTSAGEVWIALEKDTNTYGMLMPAARPTYSDETFSVYIRPKSVADTGSEDSADTFVITNIRMPQYYLRYAERLLSKEIIKDLEESNTQRFNFSIDFSRIFLAQNDEFLSHLSENVVLYTEYNHKKYKQYVQSYTYRMTSDEPLPEIKVDMNDELSVVYGGFATRVQKNISSTISRDVTNQVYDKVDKTMKKLFVSKKGTSLITGNVVSVQSCMSMAESNAATTDYSRRIDSTERSIGNNDATTKNLSDEIDTKADIGSVTNDLSVIRRTIETRFSTFYQSCGSQHSSEYKYVNELQQNELLWVNADGTKQILNEHQCGLDPFVYGKNYTTIS